MRWPTTARAVQQMSVSQVEARVAALIRTSGVTVLQDPSVARAACTEDSGLPRAAGGMQPRFIMRWQDADLSRVAAGHWSSISQSGKYRQADVGQLPGAGSAEGSFSAYRWRCCCIESVNKSRKQR